MNEKNKIMFGLKNVHYAIVTETTAEGKTTSSYGPVKPWPGAVSMSADPEGETSPFYADDTVYVTTDSNSGYSVSLECALVPEEIDTDVLGQTKTKEGVIVESNNDRKKYIAFLFEFDGDVKARRLIFYRCFLSRPKIEGQTKEDKVDPKTNTVEMSASPRPDIDIVDGVEKHLIKGYTSADVDTTAYNNWYKQVYVPSEAAASETV